MDTATPSKVAAYAGFGEPPASQLVLIREATGSGWRGLSPDGEVLDVTVEGRDAAEVLVNAGGELGTTQLPDCAAGEIDRYLVRYNGGLAAARKNEPEVALTWFNEAMAIAPTTCAAFNRALVLLSLGRWAEGFAELARCEQGSPLFMRPLHRAAMAAGLIPWRGEPLKGKRLLLVHDHGLGDTLMTLRYVPLLREAGADVVLMVPPELTRLAAQFAPVTANTLRVIAADYFCSTLLVLEHLLSGPMQVQPQSYIVPDKSLAGQPRGLANIRRQRIGVAWSVARALENDYPRECPLELIRRQLPIDAEVHSLQLQGTEEAASCNVITHQFADLAECAALMANMDEVISIDTAALHLAGAIGHPKVTGLLSFWHSWRWLAPWYLNMQLRAQQDPGDWESCFC